jgi:hypothetical protein
MTKIFLVYFLSTWAACPPGITLQLISAIPTRRHVDNAAQLDQESPMEETHLQLNFLHIDLTEPFINLANIEWQPIISHDPNVVQVEAKVAKAVEVEVSMSMSFILCMSISPRFMSIDSKGIKFDAVDDVPIKSIDAKTSLSPATSPSTTKHLVINPNSKTTKSPAAKSNKRTVASPTAKATKHPATRHPAKATKASVASPTAKSNKRPVASPTAKTTKRPTKAFQSKSLKRV